MFKHINETVLTCMNCQHDEVILQDEEKMKLSFKILEVEEREAGQRRRISVVTLERTQVPESGLDYTASGTETIKVSYPVWDGRHMTSLVQKFPEGTIFNYVEAQEIAEAIDKLVKPQVREPHDG